MSMPNENKSVEEIVERAIAIVSEQHAGYEMKLENLITQALTQAEEKGYTDGYKQGEFDANAAAYGEPETDHLPDRPLNSERE